MPKWFASENPAPSEPCLRFYPPPVYASSCESITHLRCPPSVSAVISRFDTTRTTVLSFKTNLLYDLATLLNVSAEVPLGDHFSILYEHQFPWWRGGKHRNALCLRYLQMSGEFRWWFHPYGKTFECYGRDSRLTGHYLGLYGMAGKYDFEYYRNICYQGEFWSAGLSYGYSFPIGRHANMEFSVSVGYARIPYRHFIPSEDYSVLFRDLEKSGTLNYIGPTKIGITLAVPITVGRIDKSGKGGGM